MLAISTAAAIIWFMLENFFFEPYCRFTLSVYPVLVFAMSGLYARNWEPTHGHTIPIFSACLLVISAVALVARTAVFTYKYVQRSRHQWKFAQLSSLVLNCIALEWPHLPSFLCFFLCATRRNSSELIGACAYQNWSWRPMHIFFFQLHICLCKSYGHTCIKLWQYK